jgi:hypothetical protein
VKATPSDNNFISNSILEEASSLVYVSRIVWPVNEEVALGLT